MASAISSHVSHMVTYLKGELCPQIDVGSLCLILILEERNFRALQPAGYFYGMCEM